MRQNLKTGGVENPDLEARWILKDILGISDADFIGGPVKTCSPEEIQKVNSIVHRRLAGEPLSRIFGEREFYGRTFWLGPKTLDPRSDTETLVRRALELLHVKQGGSILDLGTGTGCILITILAERPNLTGLGIDLSPGALAVAARNAQRHSVADRVSFLTGNWTEAVADSHDLVVCNPPYIQDSVIPALDSAVRNHDPILALSGGADGLQAYKKIFSDLNRVLKPTGKALFEIGFDQEASVTRLGKDSRIRIECVHRDTAGRPRVVEMSRGDK